MIEVFTPAELTAILSCASDRMIPFLALGAFAGIRHAEIQRLEWENVLFDDAMIENGASKAKTASRRLVADCAEPAGMADEASGKVGAGGVTRECRV